METRVFACSGITDVIFIFVILLALLKDLDNFSLCFGGVLGLRRTRSLSLHLLRRILTSGDSSGVLLSVVIW